MSDAADRLKAAIARDRAIAAGVSWVVTREERQRRAALLEDSYEPEPVSLTGGSWPFDGHEDGGVDRQEYMRRYQKAWRARRAPAPSSSPRESADKACG